mmetsp:Transcript_7825/g.23173  ORF Transcript_7825/g.23173 Transcript_7825/m.23173 type:complete len:274 (+) Transcript_7825:33-854(+)
MRIRHARLPGRRDQRRLLKSRSKVGAEIIFQLVGRELDLHEGIDEGGRLGLVFPARAVRPRLVDDVIRDPSIHSFVEPHLAIFTAHVQDEARRLRRVLPALQLVAEQIRLLVEKERRANGPRPSGHEIAGVALPFFSIFGERGPAAVAGAARKLAVRVFARGKDAAQAIGRRLHETEEEVGLMVGVPRPQKEDEEYLGRLERPGLPEESPRRVGQSGQSLLPGPRAPQRRTVIGHITAHDAFDGRFSVSRHLADGAPAAAGEGAPRRGARAFG